MSEEQTTETWRDVPGLIGYQASDLGRVRTFRKPGNAKIRMREEPRLLRQNRLPKGYLYVSLRQDGRTVHHYVHRLVLLAFRGPPPEGMESRHVNSNDPADCRLENLCWGTRTENAADRRRHGTLNCGSRNGQTRLTESKVILMRLLHTAGMSLADLSPLFDQDRENIRKIVQRQTWRHV